MFLNMEQLKQSAHFMAPAGHKLHEVNSEVKSDKKKPIRQIVDS